MNKKMSGKKFKEKLTRTYIGKEILCKECKSKRFRSFGDMKEYGFIVVHENNCPYIKRLLKRGLKV